MPPTSPASAAGPISQLPFSLPPGAIQIVLVRHGSSATHRSDANPATADGYSDPPLAQRGREQAQAVAARLAKGPVTALFATTLRRTAETAAPLADLTGFPIQVIADLREIHLGEWEPDFSLRLAAGEPLLRQVRQAGRWDVAPGAESMGAFSRRVAAGLDAVAEATGPGGTGVVFTHGGVIAEACRQVTGSEPLAFLQAENASITRLVRLPSGLRLIRTFNDTAHLDPATPTGGSHERA